MEPRRDDIEGLRRHYTEQERLGLDPFGFDVERPLDTYTGSHWARKPRVVIVHKSTGLRSAANFSRFKSKLKNRKMAMRHLAALIKARELKLATSRDIGLVRDWTEQRVMENGDIGVIDND